MRVRRGEAGVREFTPCEWRERYGHPTDVPLLPATDDNREEDLNRLARQSLPGKEAVR